MIPEYSCCQMRLPMLEPAFFFDTVAVPEELELSAPDLAESEDELPEDAESLTWSKRTTPRCLSKLAFLMVTVALLDFNPCSSATDSSMVTV